MTINPAWTIIALYSILSTLKEHLEDMDSEESDTDGCDEDYQDEVDAEIEAINAEIDRLDLEADFNLNNASFNDSVAAEINNDIWWREQNGLEVDADLWRELEQVQADVDGFYQAAADYEDEIDDLINEAEYLDNDRDEQDDDYYCYYSNDEDLSDTEYDIAEPEDDDFYDYY